LSSIRNIASLAFGCFARHLSHHLHHLIPIHRQHHLLLLMQKVGNTLLRRKGFSAISRRVGIEQVEWRLAHPFFGYTVLYRKNEPAAEVEKPANTPPIYLLYASLTSETGSPISPEERVAGLLKIRAQERRAGPLLPEPAPRLEHRDVLRPDHLSCYGYEAIATPAIDHLADQGVLFEHAFADVTWTTPSMASVMTGLYAPHHGLQTSYQRLSPRVKTLAEYLRGNGFETGAIIGSFPLDAIFGLNQRFLSDPDTFWHIATGKWMLAVRAFPRQDIFSHTAYGQPWVSPEWLAQVILFEAYDLLGWSGLVLLCGLVTALTFALLLLGAWLVWFFFAPIPRYEVTSTARLEVDQQIRPVQSPVLARVVTTNLQLGREVHAGDVLVELDSATERFQVQEETAHVTALTSEIASLRAQVQGTNQARTQEQQTSRIAQDQAAAKFREADTMARSAADEAKRLEQLHKQDLIPRREYERGAAVRHQA
jgi:hypothetical protein